jgi:hypothetical protein
MPSQSWIEATWVTTADGSALASSTSEALLFPDIPVFANTFLYRKVLGISCWGRISNIVTAVPTITFRLRWGGLASGVIIAYNTITCSATAFTNSQWRLYAELFCRADGATGSVMCQGTVDMVNATTLGPQFIGSAGANTPAAVTIDTSVDKLLSITAQWSASSSSNSIQGISCAYSSLN